MYVEITIAVLTHTYTDKDIWAIVTSDRSKSIYDQMLASGKMSQSEYNNAQILPGIFRYPAGAEEQYRTLILVSDETFSAAEITEYTSKDSSGRPWYYLDYTSILSQACVDIAKDTNQIFEDDYNYPRELKALLIKREV